jgi:hypothetical protein
MSRWVRLSSQARSFVAAAAVVGASLLTGCSAAASTGEEEAAVSSAPHAPPAPAAAVFNDPEGWTVHRDDGVYTQRYRIDGGAIFCESATRAAGTVSRALALLQEEWTWYGGAVEDYEVMPNGGRHYRLWPEGKLALVNVTENMHAPERLDDGGVRVLIDLDGYATGLAYIEVHPGDAGEILLVGRFAGVRSNVLPDRIFTIAHLGAEGGDVLGVHTHGGFDGLKAALLAEE